MSPSSQSRPPIPVKLPAPTYAPAIVAGGVVLIAWGLVTTWALWALGVLLTAGGLAGWFAEIRREH